MATVVSGVVTNGLIVPAAPLPEGAHVEVRLKADTPLPAASETCLSAGELLRLPREKRTAFLAAAAASAEELYRTDKELTGFDAFSEELDDDAAEG